MFQCRDKRECTKDDKESAGFFQQVSVMIRGSRMNHKLMCMCLRFFTTNLPFFMVYSINMLKNALYIAHVIFLYG